MALPLLSLLKGKKSNVHIWLSGGQLCSKGLSRNQTSGCIPANSSPLEVAFVTVCLPTFHRILLLYFNYFWKPESTLSHFRRNECVPQVSHNFHSVQQNPILVNLREQCMGGNGYLINPTQVQKEQKPESPKAQSFKGTIVRIKCSNYFEYYISLFSSFKCKQKRFPLSWLPPDRREPALD